MFFSMIFYTDKKGRGTWTINPVFRFLMLAIFLLSSAALFFNQERGTGGMTALSLIIPAFFALISLFGVLYRDSCIFDTQSRIVTYNTGMIFLSKRRLIPFDNIGSVRFITVYQGKKPIEFQCALYSKEDSILADIEHVKKSGRAALELKGKKAASLIGCAFEQSSL